MNKINFCVIPPSSQLELMDMGIFYFCLTQIYVKDEEYRNFFTARKAEGKFVIMDCGVGDGDPVSQNILFEVMKDLMPSEIIPLDVLYNGKQTYYNVVDFISRMKRENLIGKVQIQAVPQGNTFEEWLNCYMHLISLPEVDTIGMSKIGIPWAVSRSIKDQNIARDRNVVFDYLSNEELLKKPLHFLGAETPLEYRHYKDSPYVRSTDSCFSVFSAIEGFEWEQSQFDRTPTPRNYFDLEMTQEQVDRAKRNINQFRKILSSE